MTRLELFVTQLEPGDLIVNPVGVRHGVVERTLYTGTLDFVDVVFADGHKELVHTSKRLEVDRKQVTS